MTPLKKGDPCPCCGRPIKTDIPEVLYVLGWISSVGRIPTPHEIELILQAYYSPKKEVPNDGQSDVL